MRRRAVVGLAVVAVMLRAEASPPPNADPDLHAWFERQHRKADGLSCCGQADGYVLEDDEWRAAGDHYEVRLRGAWREVPGNKGVDPVGGPNPTGHAVVWLVWVDGVPTIFCFIPGTQT